MAKSIMQTEKRCYVCGTTYNLHDHHIFYGTANRKQSEKHGFKVFLCGRHHNLSNEGVHFNPDLDLGDGGIQSEKDKNRLVRLHGKSRCRLP